MSSSQSKPTLKLDWCSYEAAKYAVEKWHYSKKMPSGKLVHVGVWELGRFIGVLLFGTGAAPQAAQPYKLGRFEICELVRVALTNHVTAVSRIIGVALRLLRRQSPGLRLVVSYADPAQGHMGTIYQASGWLYTGQSEPKWRANGQHNRAFGTSIERAKQRFGPNVKIEWEVPKYKYLYPLDPAMRSQILPLAKPYPKRAASIVVDASGDQPEEEGSTPIAALQEVR